MSETDTESLRKESYSRIQTLRQLTEDCTPTKEFMRRAKRIEKELLSAIRTAHRKAVKGEAIDGESLYHTFAERSQKHLSAPTMHHRLCGVLAKITKPYHRSRIRKIMNRHLKQVRHEINEGQLPLQPPAVPAQCRAGTLEGEER